MEVQIEVTVGSMTYRFQESYPSGLAGGSATEIKRAIDTLNKGATSIITTLDRQLPPNTAAAKVNPDAESREVKSGTVNAKMIKGPHGPIDTDPYRLTTH